MVLMLLRDRPPNAGSWNSLGDKISPGETPLECVDREVLEEARATFSPEEIRSAGIVRWTSGVDPTGPGTGMYAFVAEVPESSATGYRRTPEGLLSCKPLAWASDHANEFVVSSVPKFLPGMLGETGPDTAASTLAGVTASRP